MHRRLSYYRNQLTTLRRAAVKKRNQSTTKMTVEEVIQGASQYLSGVPLAFVSSQLRAVGRKKNGRRWTNADKLLALSIYHRSPATYRFLAKHFTQPSQSSLRRWLQGMHFEPGFCESVFASLEAKVQMMSVNDRLSALCIDEMAIKTALEYDSRRDVVDGFEDFGETRTEKTASEALVFMVKGLCRKWKQPLCYFLSAGATTSDRMRDLVLEVISRLSAAGLTVKIVVCDQGANNRALFTKLGVSVDKPFIDVNGTKTYFMHDPPHLLKSIRNNFRKYNVQFDGGIAKWDHVKAFFDRDSRQTVKLAPKLKQVHLTLNNFKTMNVRLAAQVMSHTVAAGLCLYASLPGDFLPPEAAATAEFVEYIDKLFDSCNGVNFHDVKTQRRPVTDSSFHVPFWKDALKWLEKVKFLNARGTIYCVDGWRLSLSAILMLWEELSGKLKFLSTRRLNQDCLESFFSSIRQKGGCRDNPSAAHFRSAMRQCVANSLIVSLEGGNCEIDDDAVLVSLQSMDAKSASSRAVPVNENCRRPALSPTISTQLSDVRHEIAPVACKSIALPEIITVAHAPQCVVTRDSLNSIVATMPAAQCVQVPSGLSAVRCFKEPVALVSAALPRVTMVSPTARFVVTRDSLNSLNSIVATRPAAQCVQVPSGLSAVRCFKEPVALVSAALPRVTMATPTARFVVTRDSMSTVRSVLAPVRLSSAALPRIVTAAPVVRFLLTRSSPPCAAACTRSPTSLGVNESPSVPRIMCAQFNKLGTQPFTIASSASSSRRDVEWVPRVQPACTQPVMMPKLGGILLTKLPVTSETPSTFVTAPSRVTSSSSHTWVSNCSEKSSKSALVLIEKYKTVRKRRFLLRNACKFGSHILFENAMTYVAGYIAYKINSKHKCDACMKALCKDGDLLDSQTVYIHLKAFCVGDFGKLMVPSE
jgi:hypothetical protein